MRIDTKEFIKRARAKHGDKFDYSKVEYKGRSKEVVIICPIHGEFNQEPDRHLRRNHPCKICKMNNGTALSLSDDKISIIAKSKNVKRLTKIYKNGSTLMEWECNTCKTKINKTLEMLKVWTGCNICKPRVISNQYGKMTQEKWISLAKEKHGDKFDYSKVEYKGGKEKVVIICPIHGEFNQRGGTHLRSKWGCRKCSKDAMASAHSSNKDEFIKKARAKHGDLYDYSKVKYINARTKVTIICKKHGEFEQTPDRHLSKGGNCRRCNNDLRYKGWNEFYFFEPIIRDYFKEYKIEDQWPVEKEINPEYNYLIDFVIPELNLAIEYDEKYHSGNLQGFKDKSRQNYIEKKTGLHFIRVSDEKFMMRGKEYFIEILKENNIAIDKLNL